MWAPEPNEISWLSDGSSTVSGHWNWVGESSHGWIYRKIDDYRPASLIIGYHLAGRELAWARWIVRGILIAGGVLMILTAIIAIVVGRRLSQPILALADAARSVERLELEKVLRTSATAGCASSTWRTAPSSAWRAACASTATYLPRALVERLIAQQGALPPSEDRAITILFFRPRRLRRLYARPPGRRDGDLSQRPVGARGSGDRGDGRHHRQVHRRRPDGLLGRARTQRRSRARRLPRRAGNGA